MGGRGEARWRTSELTLNDSFSDMLSKQELHKLACAFAISYPRSGVLFLFCIKDLLSSVVIN